MKDGAVVTDFGRPARYVGRVGALAVMLGVGGVIAPAIASADDTPARPSHSAAERSVPARAAVARSLPQRTPAAAAARTARPSVARQSRGAAMSAAMSAAIAGAPDPLATRPARRADPTAPAALPMVWAAAAVTRREFAAPMASPMAAAVVAPAAVAAPPVAGASLGSILDPLISAFAEDFVRQYFPDSGLAPLVGHIAPIFVDGLADWIFNGTVSPEVDRLASDPVVLQGISDIVSGQLTGAGAPAQVGVAVGDATATWVNLAFSDTQGAPMRASFDAFLANLPGIPSGWDTTRLLLELALGNYTFDQLINDQLGTPLQTGINSFLADDGVQLAVSNATAGAVSVLLGNIGPSWNPAAGRSLGVPALVGDGFGQAVAAALLGDSPESADIRQRVGDIVSRLLNDPALGDAAARTVGTTFATLLDQPEIRDAVAISAANALRGVFGVPQVPVPTVQDAVGTTVTRSVSTLLADTRVIAAVGRGFSDTFATVMSNAAVQQLIGGFIAVPLGGDAGQAVAGLLATPGFRDGLASALGGIPMNLLGAPAVRAALAVAFGQIARDLTAGAPVADATGPALKALLNDPAVRRALGNTTAQLAIDVTGALARWGGTVIEEPTARALATYVGTAVTGFLDYPGMNAVLTDTVDGVVSSALDGTDGGGALYTLVTNSTYRAALGATIPELVSSVFGDSGIRKAVGQLASVAVVNLMRGGVVDIPILNVAVGQATYAAVTSLLADTTVAQLVSTLGIGALSAMPSNDLLDVALHSVLTEFGLQAALGFALGRGVGALFGDNIFAQAFGEVTGAATTLVIVAAAGITRLFVGDFAPPPAASIDTGHFFVTLPVAGDLYVVSANA